MGKTLVYNAGESEETEGVIRVVKGMFFDGTMNNLINVSITKKMRGIDEFEGIEATEEDKKIFERHAMKWNWIMLDFTPKLSDSYANDFSNIARTYQCSDTANYAIYIDGAGTDEGNSDQKIMGGALGEGATGIFSKVKKGCDLLADKILTELNASPYKAKLNRIELVLDVFGFSRGAATARNFVYNLQMAAYTPKRSAYTYLVLDHDGNNLSQGYLQNSTLPPMGHLGISLQTKGLSREIIDKIVVNIRFLGLYDTVASYHPLNGALIISRSKPNFEAYIGKLHLNEIDPIQKAVHFTALDEHRQNFSLTRLHNGMERNFPGVHGDIGGMLNNAEESHESIVSIGGALEERMNAENHFMEFRQHLIDEGWFKDDQISFSQVKGNYDIPVSVSLSTKRFVRKEYSYILLHFMREQSQALVGNGYISGKLEQDYPVEDPILIAARDFLQIHTIEGNKDWKLGSGNDALLRQLRNGYLHWSANYDSIGMGPTEDGVRKEF